MDDRAIHLPWDKIFVLTPLGQTVLRRITVKFTKEYGDILAYPLGQTQKNHPGGVPLLKWRLSSFSNSTAQWRVPESPPCFSEPQRKEILKELVEKALSDHVTSY